MLTHLDPISKAILEAVARRGYDVSAVDDAARRRFLALSDDGDAFESEAADAYEAACQLAMAIGIDMSDEAIE